MRLRRLVRVLEDRPTDEFRAEWTHHGYRAPRQRLSDSFVSPFDCYSVCYRTSLLHHKDDSAPQMARATACVDASENVHNLHDRIHAKPTLLSNFRSLRYLAFSLDYALPIANPKQKASRRRQKWLLLSTLICFVLVVVLTGAGSHPDPGNLYQVRRVWLRDSGYVRLNLYVYFGKKSRDR